MNKNELIAIVKDQLGVSASRARSIVDTVFGEVERAVATGQKVSLRGLGVFEQVVEGAARVPVFRPAKTLTDAVLAASGRTSGSAETAPAKKAPAAKKAAPAAKKSAAKKAPAAKKSVPAKKSAAKKAAPAAAKKSAAKKAAPGAAKRSAAATNAPVARPEVVPPPLPDPDADALAAVRSELAREVPVAEPEPITPPVDDSEPDDLVFTTETPDTETADTETAATETAATTTTGTVTPDIEPREPDLLGERPGPPTPL